MDGSATGDEFSLQSTVSWHWSFWATVCNNTDSCLILWVFKFDAMIVLVLCVVIAITFVIKYMSYKQHMESFVKNLPMLKPCYPLIGCAFNFIGKNTTQLFEETVQIIKSHETPCVAWVGPLMTISVDKPEDVKAVLMSPTCLERPYVYRFLPSTLSLLTMASTWSLD